MLEHLLTFSVTRMSKVIKVSRSGFYHWLKHRHKATSRELARHELDSKVKEAFIEGKERDGARRIQKALDEDCSPYNIKTISHSMKRQDLVAKAARKFKCTTDSNHTRSISPNLFAQDFSATGPNQKWREISPISQPAKAGCTLQ